VDNRHSSRGDSEGAAAARGERRAGGLPAKIAVTMLRDKVIPVPDWCRPRAPKGLSILIHPASQPIKFQGTKNRPLFAPPGAQVPDAVVLFRAGVVEEALALAGLPAVAVDAESIKNTCGVGCRPPHPRPRARACWPSAG